MIITGLSGSGKGTVLKAFEDLGYYSVDNLPIELIPKFAELAKAVPNIRRAAMVVDIREGRGAGPLSRPVQAHPATKFPRGCCFSKPTMPPDPPLQRNPPSASSGRGQSVAASIRSERERLAPIRRLADPIINTSKFNVHELRDTIHTAFRGQKREAGDPDSGDQLRLPPRRAHG